MSSPTFESLPPELVVRIASRLDTPRDLVAFIKISKYVYQVFRHSQIAILAAVIRSAMPDGNVYTAVAACDAARISKLWWTTSSDAAVAKARHDFFGTYPHGRAAEACSLRDRSLLLSLYKLWWTTEYFMHQFAKDALSIAARKMPLIQKQQHHELTSCERSRMQRAFFRFEIYRRVTPDHLQGRSFKLGPRNRPWPILKHFAPWEREEILSVQEVLVEFAKDIVRSSQDYMTREISTVAHEMVTRSEMPLATYGSEPESPMKRLKRELNTSCLDILEFHGFVERPFEHFVGRGLPFMRWLSSLPPKHKIHAIAHNDMKDCLPTLWGVLSPHNRELASNDVAVGWSDGAPTKSSDCPNQGWIWAKIHGVTRGRKLLCKRHVLRRMGYVFWNEARLRDDWRLAETLPSMLQHTPRSAYDVDDTCYEDWWPEGSRIEELFKDMPIPESESAYDRSRDDSIYGRLRVSDEWEEQVGYDANYYPTPFSKKEDELFSMEY